MAQLWLIQAINKTSIRMGQQTPAPFQNLPCTQQMTINGNLSLVDADKLFDYKLCLIVLDTESRQMAQQWPILAINNKCI